MPPPVAWKIVAVEEQALNRDESLFHGNVAFDGGECCGLDVVQLHSDHLEQHRGLLQKIDPPSILPSRTATCPLPVRAFTRSGCANPRPFSVDRRWPCRSWTP